MGGINGHQQASVLSLLPPPHFHVPRVECAVMKEGFMLIPCQSKQLLSPAGFATAMPVLLPLSLLPAPVTAGFADFSLQLVALVTARSERRGLCRDIKHVHSEENLIFNAVYSQANLCL